MSPIIHPVESWKERLNTAIEAAAHRAVVFVLGDGMARDDGGGTWGVRRVLEALEQDYGIGGPSGSDPAQAAEAYGQGLELLKAKRGQAEVARLFRRVVLAACKLPESDPRRTAALDPPNQRRACERLLENTRDWHLPRGMVALAEIVSHIHERRRVASASSAPPLLITTNFDPLLELALRQTGVPVRSQSIINDVGPVHGDEKVGIWHVHGIWTDVTMHTPQALQAERGKLRAALSRRFDRADVFVIGYGGWNDLIFSTLCEVLAEDKFDVPPEILWAFFDSDAQSILQRYPHVFRILSGALASCQVTFYGGVDAHRDLPALACSVPRLLPVLPGGLQPAFAQTAWAEARDSASDQRFFVFRLQVSVLRKATELAYRIRNAARDFNAFLQTGGALSASGPALGDVRAVMFEISALERELRQLLYENRAILPQELFVIVHEVKGYAGAIANAIAAATRMREESGELDRDRWLDVQKIVVEEFPELSAAFDRLVQAVQDHIGVCEAG